MYTVYCRLLIPAWEFRMGKMCDLYYFISLTCLKIVTMKILPVIVIAYWCFEQKLFFTYFFDYVE